MENDKHKMLLDFTVQTDHEIYGRRPDVIVEQKDKNLCQMIYFACPYDERVGIKELEKNRTLTRFTREFRNTEHESQSYTIRDRCPRTNTLKVKKLVIGNRY